MCPSAGAGERNDSVDDACTYFRNLRYDDARVDVLRRGVRSFIPADKIDDTQIEALCWPTLVAQDGKPESRVRCLGELQRRLLQCQDAGYLRAFKRRLFLLLVENETAAVAPSAETKTPVGVKKRAVAIEMMSGAMLGSVHDLLHRSKKYMMLLNTAGPGALLEIEDRRAELWERHIREAEVEAIQKYRSELPDYVKTERRHKWDFAVARLLVLGMVACGWQYEVLAQGPTELTETLREYIDFPLLRRGEIRAQSARLRKADAITPAQQPGLTGLHPLEPARLPSTARGLQSASVDRNRLIRPPEPGPSLRPIFSSSTVSTIFSRVGSSHWSCGQSSTPQEWQLRAHLIQEELPKAAQEALCEMRKELNDCIWADFQAYFTINEHQRIKHLERHMSILAQSYTGLPSAVQYTVVYFTQSQWILPLGADILIPLSITAAKVPSLSKHPLCLHRAVHLTEAVYLEFEENFVSNITFLWLHPTRGAFPSQNSALAR